MHIFKEKIEYENPLLSIKVWLAERNSSFPINWHHHPECELMLIQQGKLEVEVGSELYTLQAGDVIVLGSSQLHRDRSFGERLEYIVLQFDLQTFFDQSTIPYLQYFNETKVPLSAMNYIFRDNEKARRGVADCIREIYEESLRKASGYELAVNLLIKRILLILIRSDTLGLLADQDRVERIRLKPVLDYVEDNISERITVEEACRLINMSYYYFVKFFKKTMGLSFTEYVNFRKIKRAEQLLLTRDLSISEVGDQTGMPNMAHFYKMFKRFNHCSPKEFQRKMLGWNRR
ncbi:AraC family transcriptional regulator [Cohnella lubricantis]|uniref:Helix-turn-helix transcriptional regulator n=1 Tax=Cohnella lubricantis TaxID=2163172 RepID=A0A841T7R2_9BACL|nr:AraC family transcriptional regulator [Cohnella lubricantis]MBB6676015.1 helix-turn-helix transcriptional regulator [Cohnella lubricantis]MBP2117972.1 AraC-like DNA-binding protein/mannose-6-phosphate isomerase-like protein (cupin superfamily) [Cohnella lubricantis]